MIDSIKEEEIVLNSLRESAWIDLVVNKIKYIFRSESDTVISLLQDSGLGSLSTSKTFFRINACSGEDAGIVKNKFIKKILCFKTLPH